MAVFNKYRHVALKAMYRKAPVHCMSHIFLDETISALFILPPRCNQLQGHMEGGELCGQPMKKINS
jgi:hypothetical protein